jgi:hypothetical protein
MSVDPESAARKGKKRRPPLARGPSFGAAAAQYLTPWSTLTPGPIVDESVMLIM